MNTSQTLRRPPARVRPARQRGIVMIFTLIALVLLMIGALALLRSVDSSSILVGNLAFRRDLTNRAETAIATARAALVSGDLATEAARIANQTGSTGPHYYASRQAGGSNGIPALLLSDSAYSAAFGAPSASSDGITLRWVIDRQCTAPGAFDYSSCEYIANTSADGSGTGGVVKPSGSTRPVYRISVRVTGPRGTEAYLQTTYAD